MLSLRERPRYDAAPVPETDRTFLDQALVARFLESVRTGSPRLKDASDEQVLRAKRVIEPSGDRLTMAGLYALGDYPQQFAPTLSLTAVAHTSPDSSVRNADRQEFDGPLPVLLEDAAAWVRRNTRTRVRFGADGHGFDEDELPLVAVRELIANALVHRALGPHASSKDVQLHLYNDRLVITNPGGLWGLTTSQIGLTGEKSAVNEYLYEVCKHVRTSRANRVIEGEGGGLREVHASLRRAGMRPAEFHDNSVRFTVILSRQALISEEDLVWLSELPANRELTDLQRQLLVAMRHGQEWTNQLVRSEFAPLDSTEAQTALQGLAIYGLAVVGSGDRGVTYVIAPEHRALVEARPEALVESQDRRPLKVVSKNAPRVADTLESGPLSMEQIAEAAELTRAQVQYAVNAMLEAGLLERRGGRGQRNTVYVLESRPTFERTKNRHT